MRRRWIYFDVETIRAELGLLPVKDAAKLRALMEHYRTVGAGNPAPAQIDDYGSGLFRLRHVKSAYQSRMIYFVLDRTTEEERLVVLTVYKKEGQAIPQRVLDRARARMEEYRRRNKN